MLAIGIVQYRNYQLEHGFSTVFVRGLMAYQFYILEEEISSILRR